IQHQLFTLGSNGPVVTDVGSLASFIVPATGLTEVAYWANDNVGNVEQMHQVRLQPWLTLSQPSVSFGSQVIGTTSNPVTVNIGNTGGMELTVNSYSATSEFTVSNPGTASGCPVAPFKLPPNGACTFAVRFAPTGPYPPGPRTGWLTINHNGANGTSVPGVSSFALDGQGIGIPHASVSQSTLQFTNTRVGTSSEQVVMLTNDGWDTLAI